MAEKLVVIGSNREEEAGGPRCEARDTAAVRIQIWQARDLPGLYTDPFMKVGYLEIKAFRLELVSQLAKQHQCVSALNIATLYRRAMLPFGDLCTVFGLLAGVWKSVGWWWAGLVGAPVEDTLRRGDAWGVVLLMGGVDFSLAKKSLY